MQHRTPDRRWPLVITESRRKLLRWHGAVRAMGLHPRSLVTAGHFCAYPEDLEKIGFRITAAGLDEFARLPEGEFPRRLLRELSRHPAGAPILIATDADQEGDVIAFDVARMILRHAPALLSCTFRARPASMHADDLQAAVERAVAESSRPGGAARRYALMERDAAPGRARDVLDRQLGAEHSRAAGQPCGRVKAAALGAVRMWSERPEALRRIPETGELRLRAAAADGGRPFAARVALHGRVPEGLVRLAARFRGGDVPGVIHQPAPLGAAVAPRDGTAALPNTGDALIEACRRNPEINAMAAMNGLNTAHMAGLISYPRTAARHVTEETARRMAAFARECGVPGLPGSVHEWAAPVAADGAHEALHLAPGADVDYLAECFGAVPRRGVARLLTGIVAERCFEAMRGNLLAWGVYRPSPGAGLADAEIALLERLEWTRPIAEPLHWTDPPETRLRLWPLDAIMVDLMMSEEIGRPSTWARHIHALKTSRWLDFPPEPDGSPPTLSPKGRDILSRLPPSAADPETTRQMQRIIEDVPCRPDGTLKAPLAQIVPGLLHAAQAVERVIGAHRREKMRSGADRPAGTHGHRAEAQDAHGRDPNGSAPQGTAEHGRAAEPIEFDRDVKEPINGGYVIKRLLQRGGRALTLVEFYNEDDFLHAVETRDGGKVLDRGEYDSRVGKIVANYPSIGAASAFADSQQRLTRRLRPATTKPPEPDCDDDYDDDHSPSM